MGVMLALLLVATPQECGLPAAERQRQMSLSYAAFDAAPAPFGWRSLNAKGCVDAAVELLQAYRMANGSKLTAEERAEMPFHIGQAYAFNGRDREGAPWFAEADSADAPEEWRAFVAAHVAFFRNDRPGLERARSRYAAATRPGSMRLKVIDGFIACIGKTYMEAAHCAM